MGSLVLLPSSDSAALTAFRTPKRDSPEGGECVDSLSWLEDEVEQRFVLSRRSMMSPDSVEEEGEGEETVTGEDEDDVPPGCCAAVLLWKLGAIFKLLIGLFTTDSSTSLLLVGIVKGSVLVHFGFTISCLDGGLRGLRRKKKSTGMVVQTTPLRGSFFSPSPQNVQQWRRAQRSSASD